MKTFAFLLCISVLLYIPEYMNNLTNNALAQSYYEIAMQVDAQYQGLCAPAFLVEQIKERANSNFDLEIARKAVERVVNKQLESQGFTNPNVKIRWYE